MLYRILFDRFIIHSDAEEAHTRAIAALKFAQSNPLGRACLRLIGGARPAHRVPARAQGGPLRRSLPGRLGLAAGMDKDAQCVEAWSRLGFGFVEIGTVTPRPQPGNEKPRLWRIPEERALRNAMGFNNEGAEAAARRLRALRQNPRTRGIVVGANIGKNKVTPADRAADDYATVARYLAKYVDYLVINVSSPNTVGLRDLQAVESLEPILTAVQAAVAEASPREVPILVKIAPDLADADIVAVAELVKRLGLDGVAATNTTINHPYERGGVSGAPLKQRAREVVRLLRAHLGPDPIIMGMGGIETAADAQELINAGADLVEALSAFVYEGPAWPGKINRELGQAPGNWPTLRH